MDAVVIAVSGLFNLICFIVGAKVGQMVVKDETIKLPSFNPIEAIREHEAKKEAEYEQNRIDTIMRNIENYNGSASGQEDVPR